MFLRFLKPVHDAISQRDFRSFVDWVWWNPSKLKKERPSFPGRRCVTFFSFFIKVSFDWHTILWRFHMTNIVVTTFTLIIKSPPHTPLQSGLIHVLKEFQKNKIKNWRGVIVKDRMAKIFPDLMKDWSPQDAEAQ